MFGCALTSKELALVWLEHTFQHLPALCGLGIGHSHPGDMEALFGVPFRIAVAEAQSRLRDEAHAAPFEVGAQLEDLGHGF